MTTYRIPALPLSTRLVEAGGARWNRTMGCWLGDAEAVSRINAWMALGGYPPVAPRPTGWTAGDAAREAWNEVPS